MNPHLCYLVGPLRLAPTLTVKLTGIFHINADVTTKMIATATYDVMILLTNRQTQPLVPAQKIVDYALH